MTGDSAATLRADWEQEWLRATTGSPAERWALLDAYVRLHAMRLLDAKSEADRDAPLVSDDFGRAMTTRIVQRLMPEAGPLGRLLPILAGPGDAALKVERSRPGWHLDGALRGVAWDPDVDRLAVFAIDEGSNDVMALVEPGTTGVEISVVEQGTADIRFDDVTLPSVTSCAGEPALLADALTVLAMVKAVEEVDRQDDDELRLGRVALRAAAASLDSPSVVRRQHDVSAAALLVFPASARLDWHRQRLVPLL